MRLPLPQFEAGDRQSGRIAEVIETATTEFHAQCLEPQELDFPEMPPFGSWVKAADEETGNQVLAVVTHATTSPIDSVHRARALGLSLDELREQQPQIFAMLRTEFRAAILGFEVADDPAGGGPRAYQYVPPRPPQMHQGVYRCEPAEVIRFSEQLDFLRPLLEVQGTPVESLVAAVIREVYRLRGGDRAWLVAAGRALSRLLNEDYDRLRYILGQIHA